MDSLQPDVKNSEKGCLWQYGPDTVAGADFTTADNSGAQAAVHKHGGGPAAAQCGFHATAGMTLGSQFKQSSADLYLLITQCLQINTRHHNVAP